MKPFVLIISGTPGTGKSSLAKELSLSKHWKLIDINKIIQKYSLSEGYDAKRGSKIVDTKKLIKTLTSIISESQHENGIIIEGHLSHYLPKKYVNLCVITKTHISTLNKRLKKREYGQEKIRENLESEIFDICLEEAREKGHKILTIDTTELSSKQSAKKLTANLP